MPFERQPDPLQRRALLRRALGLAAGTAVGLTQDPADAAELRVGQMAPPLSLRALDGQTIATEALRGQVVLLTFWASWCAPCVEELPLLSAYAAQHAAQGLRVLGFSLDGPDGAAKMRAMAQQLHFPCGFLGSQYAGGYGRIWRLPVSFVIDRAGRLAYNGWDDAGSGWTAQLLHKFVDPLLA